MIAPHLPTFRLEANSEDITSKIMARFISLRLTDEAGMDSDMLEVTLADHDPADPIAIPPTGAELRVFLGYEGQTTDKGLYIVDEVELSGWPGQMCIRAKAAPYDTSKGGKTDLQTQKTRSWKKGVKLGDLVAKIAKEHGMQPAVAPSLASIALPHFDQTDESDISFLIRVAKRYDALAKPAGGKIVMVKLGESKNSDGDDLPTIAVNSSQVSSWRMTLATKDSPGTVIAYWHNKRNAQRIPVTIGKGEPVRRLRHWYQTEDAARAAAQAELDRRTRGERTLSITMPGDPDVQAEATLNTSGFREGVDGEWLLKRAVHSLGKSMGYQCEIEAEQDKATDDDEDAADDDAG